MPTLAPTENVCPFHSTGLLIWSISLWRIRRHRRGYNRICHRHEFITAHARQKFAGLQHGTRPVGDGAKHGVARRMAVNVIDFLETVEIDGKKRRVCAQRNMTRATIEMFDEGCPVGNAGQRIVQERWR